MAQVKRRGVKRGPNQDIFVPEKIYGIIGLPLGHSLSPLVHNWGFQQLGLKAVYFRWPLEAPCLADFIFAARSLPISGLSVTIPHKGAIMTHLQGCSNIALQAGAVNTVHWQEGHLWGENTDVHGFVSALQPAEWETVKKVLVLGYGGAARAVLVGLAAMGIVDVAVCGRNGQRAAELSEKFRAECIGWEDRGQWSGDLLVNTTPLGMKGRYQALSPWPNVSMKGIKRVYDLVYNPLETRLLQQGRSEGIATVSGLEMFLGQASAQFALWTKQSLPLLRLRDILRKSLSE
jgi:shikimate dehydrogenase